MKYRFQDNTLPFEERAKDLLSRLTREEKVGMITSQSMIFRASALKRRTSAPRSRAAS